MCLFRLICFDFAWFVVLPLQYNKIEAFVLKVHASTIFNLLLKVYKYLAPT